MLRQHPYGDKVSSHAKCDEYISSFLNRNMIPIPYLHNTLILRELALIHVKSINEVIDNVKNTSSLRLDHCDSVRKTKVSKIVSFLQNINTKKEIDVFIPIPKTKQGYIATCTSDVCLCDSIFKVNQEYGLYENDETELTLCLNIYNVRRIDNIPNDVKLPPCSIQKISDEVSEILLAHGV